MADKTRIYEDVLDLVEEEIDKIVKKGELDDKCLEYLDKLVDISKDVETITAMRGESGNGGYSSRGGYSYEGGGGRSNGNSYRGRNSMGRYSSRNSYDYRNGYSGDENMRMRLEQMMDEAPSDREREAIRRAIEQM